MQEGLRSLFDHFSRLLTEHRHAEALAVEPLKQLLVHLGKDGFKDF